MSSQKITCYLFLLKIISKLRVLTLTAWIVSSKPALQKDSYGKNGGQVSYKIEVEE